MARKEVLDRIEKYVHPFRITKGKGFRLKDFDPVDTCGLKLEKGEAVSKEASAQMLQIMRGQVYSSRLPRYVSGWRIPHKTGDFLPYIGNDVGILESQNRRVVVSVFTANHFGAGDRLEDAIGRVAELVGNYFAARP